MFTLLAAVTTAAALISLTERIVKRSLRKRRK
jgi:hypothetical protein